MNECWIIGGGHGGIADNITVPDGAFIIAADSGILLAEKLGLIPDLVIGDFDSYNGKLPDNVDFVRLPVKKDDTDMMYAVKTALKKGYTQISLCGALGGRLDHTYANIQTLEYIAANGGNGRIISDDNIVMFQNEGSVSYPQKDGWYFSVFALSEEAVVSLNGTLYTLESYPLKRSFPLGVSNEITSASAEVRIDSGNVIIMYSKK